MKQLDPILHEAAKLGWPEKQESILSWYNLNKNLAMMNAATAEEISPQCSLGRGDNNQQHKHSTKYHKNAGLIWSLTKESACLMEPGPGRAEDMVKGCNLDSPTVT